MRDETGFDLILAFHLFGSDRSIVAGKMPWRKEFSGAPTGVPTALLPGGEGLQLAVIGMVAARIGFLVGKALGVS